nr:hypothetical protein CFP56_45031 [Quercus suber]
MRHDPVVQEALKRNFTLRGVLLSLRVWLLGIEEIYGLDDELALDKGASMYSRDDLKLRQLEAKVTSVLRDKIFSSGDLFMLPKIINGKLTIRKYSIMPCRASGTGHLELLAVSKGQHQGFSLWNEADNNDSVIEIDDGEFSNPVSTTVNTCDDPISQSMETVPRSENGSAGDPPELHLPGLIIHMVPHQRSSHMSLWKCCTVLKKAQSYKAYIANRESFKDITSEFLTISLGGNTSEFWDTLV